jgi:hypothetical protein
MENETKYNFIEATGCTAFNKNNLTNREIGLKYIPKLEESDISSKID